jgi:hypothetical protein
MDVRTLKIFEAVIATANKQKIALGNKCKKALIEEKDRMAMNKLMNSTRRDEIGRTTTVMPYIASLDELGNTLLLGTQRLRVMERRMEGDDVFKRKYSEFMDNYGLDGLMIALDGDPYRMPQKNSFCFPHHPIFKEGV